MLCVVVGEATGAFEMRNLPGEIQDTFERWRQLEVDDIGAGGGEEVLRESTGQGESTSARLEISGLSQTDTN